jgi:hypothetical protein
MLLKCPFKQWLINTNLMATLASGNYLELYAGNFNTGRDVYIVSINLFAMGMYAGN